MNQKLLVIIAALLLLMGGAGLMLSVNGEPDRPERRVEISVFTANKLLLDGQAFTAENFTKTVSEVAVSEAISHELLPATLIGYRAVGEIAAGETISKEKIEVIPKETVFLSEGHFIYHLKQSAENSPQLTLLKKGDLLDVYLRYYVRKKSDGENKLLDPAGSLLQNSEVKWLKILSEKRFFSLSAENNVADKLKGQEQGATILGLELDSSDVVKVNSVKHLGELITFSADTLVDSNGTESLIPEMVKEIRGRTIR